MSNGFFSDQNIVPSIGDVQCSGTELELLDCLHSNSPDSTCLERDDAGVVCQGESLQYLYIPFLLVYVYIVIE